MIIGVSSALSEAEVRWRVFLNGLKQCGMAFPDLVRSDACSGLKAAIQASLNADLPVSSPAKRLGISHKQHLKCKLVSEIKVIFNAEDRAYAGSSSSFRL
jgi:hypothetical protein